MKYEPLSLKYNPRTDNQLIKIQIKSRNPHYQTFLQSSSQSVRGWQFLPGGRSLGASIALRSANSRSPLIAAARGRQSAWLRRPCRWHRQHIETEWDLQPEARNRLSWIQRGRTATPAPRSLFRALASSAWRRGNDHISTSNNHQQESSSS